MLQMFVIALREGIESFLIVAITLAYLRKSGRQALLPAVYAGTAVSIAASFGAGWLFSQAENKPLWEGLLALAAALLVASMVFYMMRVSKRLRAEIAQHIDDAAAKAGFAAQIGVFLFILLMITREGMEIALLVSGLAMRTDTRDMLAGTLSGIAGAGLLAWAWVRYGQRIPLARFFQVTSIFLLLFAVQLVFYAFHELTEGSVLPIDNQYWHIATEPWAPEGQYGAYLTYALVIVPLLWLAYTTLRGERRNAAS
ncbi:MAG TPA: FTR1 family protein [Novimethylophilus sp.]|jgi:high-affinity iron transporter|uniref:FTR1 family iron permease n=1 Tax=Novimethylophilus sp. TaxID=2137426 RepID=UPI002F419060